MTNEEINAQVDGFRAGRARALGVVDECDAITATLILDEDKRAILRDGDAVAARAIIELAILGAKFKNHLMVTQARGLAVDLRHARSHATQAGL